MIKQTKGKCKYCGKEYAKGYMIRHLASCKERKKKLEEETGKRGCGYFELSVYGKYEHEYWLLVEIKDTATLKDLDRFLRDIWLECCGHLSAFNIAGVSYEISPSNDYFWGNAAKSMNYKLKSVLEKGMTLNYEYDFGSTTELVIEVKDYRQGFDRKEKMVILSRNQPITFVCGECGKEKAVYIAPELIYERNPFLCEKCSNLERYEEEILLNVCNSPRMGVCGYEGSRIYPEEFVPDMDESSKAENK